ncbi:hypothetical protein D3879_09615 [Pseudomonas cavernicola]|uniref:Uncharacterized protein n=1 Tax=Pseudomonas cavernicola TaxID=2320866 RepID=A0A418XLZ0_9PSED|nr:hypothetical protein [Pseudomonas cavernicola]RJG13477.1 hypothetical protein D3879_09615 [Pseudomonas cavernicola]
MSLYKAILEYGEYAYLPILALFLVALTMNVSLRLLAWKTIVIWCLNLPIALLCFVLLMAGGAVSGSINLMVVVIALSALAQLGWVGCACDLAGKLWPGTYLRSVGFWISVASLTLHVLFMLLIVFGWSGK